MAQPSPRGGSRQKGPDPAEYAGLGLTFGAGILLFTFVGSWLDRRLGTEPWLLLVGVFVGFGLSLLWIYRRLVIVPRERERDGEP